MLSFNTNYMKFRLQQKNINLVNVFPTQERNVQNKSNVEYLNSKLKFKKHIL